LEDFDFAKNPNVTPEVMADLKSASWVREGRPLVLIGDSGTGKSHLLIGVGIAIVEAGLSVRYITTFALVNELAEADAGRRLSSVIARYSKVDLRCLDEFGFSQPGPQGCQTAFSDFHGARGTEGDRGGDELPVRRVGQDLRRSPPLRGHCRPDHLLLHSDSDRHRVLPLSSHRIQTCQNHGHVSERCSRSIRSVRRQRHGHQS